MREMRKMMKLKGCEIQFSKQMKTKVWGWCARACLIVFCPVITEYKNPLVFSSASSTESTLHSTRAELTEAQDNHCSAVEQRLRQHNILCVCVCEGVMGEEFLERVSTDRAVEQVSQLWFCLF